MNKATLSLLLKIAAVLWIVWGLVHTLAGAATITFVLSNDIPTAFGGIADAVNTEAFRLKFPEAAGAVLGQHGFNLLWFGLVTTICGFFIWRKNKNAIFLAVIVGGLADLGYFLFLDLGGYVNFFPGTVMTLVSSAAIILSLVAYFRSDRLRVFEGE